MFNILKTTHIAKHARFLGVLLCAVFFSSHIANAQFAPTPCDTNYYQSLEARAWLEAQREITQNQNLIYKPDSVLEYTCFDNHLRELAAHAVNMFSETTRWGTILPDTSMDAALQSLVSAALVRYDTANFASSLLGGRVAVTGGWNGTAPAEATGPVYLFESTINASQAYACDMMQAIWQKAKCMNFAAVAAEDGFFTFDDYATDPDKRFLPSRCADVHADFTSNLTNALPDVTATTPWEHDIVETNFDRFFPATGCGTGANRVRTGLVVEDNSRASGTSFYYLEHVCLVPGCHWEPTNSGGASIGSPQGGGTCQPL